MTDKTLGDHVTDWLRILAPRGVPTLLVGLGWILILYAALIGSSWSSNAGFWVATVGGTGMVIMGVLAHLKGPKPTEESK